MIAKATSRPAFISSLVYSFGLLLLLGVSAVYHRPHWEPKGRAMMKRFDHSAIFFLIAGTFTPICLLALPPGDGHRLLIIVWSAAAFGVLQSIFWVKAPKWVTAVLYIAMGWMALPYLAQLKESLGVVNVWFLAAGGVVYTVGALFYVFKKPNFFPGTFGYHELFHVFTVVGAALHFVVVYHLIV